MVGDADIVSIDFGAGFDLTEAPDTEINIVLDYTEDPVILSGSEITGTLATGNGGTGQTANTADSVLIGTGAVYTARVIPDCDTAGDSLRFDTTTDGWSCNTTTDISTDTNLTCGTNCTLTDDEISVDDAFLLNNGDVGTGAFDFGGATDFEIPNGPSETPNVNGEIATDTSDDQLKYFSTALRVLTHEYTKSFVIGDPIDADTILIWEAPFDLTIQSWSCIVDPADSAETVIVDLRETTATGDTGVTIDATVTCDNDEANDDGALSNGTIDAGDYVLVDVGVVTGTVTWLSISFVYTVDAS
jgi:hypothetical protein